MPPLVGQRGGDGHPFRWGLLQCGDAADIKGAARLGDSTMQCTEVVNGDACFVTEM